MTRATHRLTATACILFFLALGGMAVREVAQSSRFQIFGDFVARIDTPERVVALTFDDGPHPTNTGPMLDLLDAHGIKATFFMMGRSIERHPDIAREVLARGHEAGNHSYSHPKLVLMSPAKVREEVERTDALLRGIGVTGPIHFRAPHAAKLVVLPWVLTRMGKVNVQGDVDPEEWRQRPADVMTASVLKQVRPGSIIGFHDTQGDRTRATVHAVLTVLLADGYRFERVSEFLRRRKS